MSRSREEIRDAMSGAEIVDVCGGYMALFLYDRIDSYTSRGTLVSQAKTTYSKHYTTSPGHLGEQDS